MGSWKCPGVTGLRYSLADGSCCEAGRACCCTLRGGCLSALHHADMLKPALQEAKWYEQLSGASLLCMR